MREKYTPAAIAARDRYNKKAYDDIKIRVPKGQRAIIKKYADETGMSMSAYIVHAVDALKRID